VPKNSIARRVRSEAGGIAVGAACLVATNAFALAIPWLIKHAIDALHAGETSGRQVVARDAILIAVLAALQGLIRTWSRIFIFNAGRNIEYGLRRDLFRHLTRLDPGFYRRHRTGDMMSRLTNDLGAVRMLFGPGILNLFNTALIYATTLWLLFALSPRLTLWSLLPYPALLIGARLYTRRMYRASRAIQEQLGTMSTAIQEDLAGIAVIKNYTLEDGRQAGFRALNEEYLVRSLSLARARGALMPLFAVMAGIGTFIVLWLGGREVIAGRMTVGGLVAFNAYLVLLSWPTMALGWIIGLWQRGIAGWMRVRELLETVPGVADHPSGSPEAADAAPGRAGAFLDVTDLTVAIDGRQLLDHVSFSLAEGATLAVVGPTGAGKTTLVDALLRLHDVAPGAIRIGGRDITRMPLAELRGLFGYAPQDAFLFSATVAENIGFGMAAPADPAAVQRAAEAAGLAPDIAILPEGYETLVGERGLTLSGGQRQRVALARALASDPRILVLDDSLSSVDAQTERDILARLRPILAGRTAILISHRVAAVKDADQILVLDGGRIAERGTHAELLAGNGVYASLYREQLAAESLAEQEVA
jgi:ATP-binding cassette, subfamily B, multidrug efflux pump